MTTENVDGKFRPMFKTGQFEGLSQYIKSLSSVFKLVSIFLVKMLSRIESIYNALMARADPRHADWPMMSGPMPTVSFCLTYVLLVKVIGPQLMQNRKPFDLRLLMIIYNFSMVIVSGYIVYIGSDYWVSQYSWFCQPVNYSLTPHGMLEVKISYLYYLTKFVEFIDTFIFVLRKKTGQISTLHVIHHGLMPFSVWWGLKFVPGGHATFFGFINSAVHVVMYTYYGLAALGPNVTKYLWWKKYLTVLQLIQFVMIFVHSMQLLVWKDCGFPKAFGLWIGAHGLLFWFLFIAFYKKAYPCSKNVLKAVKTIASSCHPQDLRNGDILDENCNNLRKKAT